MHVLVLLQHLKQTGPSHAAPSSDQQQELMRVRAELEKKNVQYEEELSRRETLHSTELKGLKNLLRDSDGQHLTLQKEILMLKDKLEKTRRERYMYNYIKIHSFHHVIIQLLAHSAFAQADIYSFSCLLPTYTERPNWRTREMAFIWIWMYWLE